MTYAERVLEIVHKVNNEPTDPEIVSLLRGSVPLATQPTAVELIAEYFPAVRAEDVRLVTVPRRADEAEVEPGHAVGPAATSPRSGMLSPTIAALVDHLTAGGQRHTMVGCIGSGAAASDLRWMYAELGGGSARPLMFTPDDEVVIPVHVPGRPTPDAAQGQTGTAPTPATTVAIDDRPRLADLPQLCAAVGVPEGVVLVGLRAAAKRCRMDGERILVPDGPVVIEGVSFTVAALEARQMVVCTIATAMRGPLLTALAERRGDGLAYVRAFPEVAGIGPWRLRRIRVLAILVACLAGAVEGLVKDHVGLAPQALCAVVVLAGAALCWLAGSPPRRRKPAPRQSPPGGTR